MIGALYTAPLLDSFVKEISINNNKSGSNKNEKNNNTGAINFGTYNDIVNGTGNASYMANIGLETNPFGFVAASYQKIFNNLDSMISSIVSSVTSSISSSSSESGSSSESSSGGLGESISNFVGNVASSVKKAVEIAWRELKKGVHETSENDSIDIRRYKNGARNNHQWCAYFSSYLYSTGQNSGNKDTFGYTGSSQAIRKAAQRAGHYATLKSGYRPKVGDLAIWKKTESTGHVGIVVEVYDDHFVTIEGNSSNRVKKNTYYYNRPPKNFHGFVKMSEWKQA